MNIFQKLTEKLLTLRCIALSSGCLVAFVVAASLLPGCSSDSSDEGSGKTGVEFIDEPTTSIATILASLQADQYGISVPRDLPASELNTWADENLDKLLADDVDETDLTEKLRPLLSEEQIHRVLRREFVIRDAVHIRDMIWARQLIDAQRNDGESDRDLVVRLFYHVVHTVRLTGPSELELPLSPFGTMLYGRGTAADRVWVLSCLTRQLRLPLLVVELPAKQAGDGEEVAASKPPLLAGVVLDGELLLFDFDLGLPVPSASCPPGEALPSIPATLSEVRSSDAVLRELDAGEDQPYPLTASHFQNVRLLLVGDSSLWARRLEAVQYAMSGTKDPAVVYEPLVAHGAFEDGGVMEIIAEELDGQVTADSLGVWNYPEAQRGAREELTAKQKTLLEKMNEPMQAPRPYLQTVRDDKPPEIEYATGRQKQLQARIAQILGQPKEAIRIYIRIQSWRNSAPKANPHQPIHEVLKVQLQQLPDDVLRMHARAAIEASFWQATCQLQQGKFIPATTDFNRWIRSSSSPELFGQAHLLNGISLARQERMLSASGFLNKITNEDPCYPAAQVLLNRWKAID